jgi:hypothetical protein
MYLMTTGALRTEAISRLTASNFRSHTGDPLAGHLLVIEHPQVDRATVEQIIVTLDPEATQLASFKP